MAETKVETRKALEILHGNVTHGIVLAGNCGENIGVHIMRVLNPEEHTHLRLLIINTDGQQLYKHFGQPKKVDPPKTGTDPTEEEKSNGFFEAWLVSPQFQLLQLKKADGLGTGGDKALALEAITAESKTVDGFIIECESFDLVGGLGGGTASTVLPYLAQKIVEAKKSVLCLHTMPASWEGGERIDSAETAQNKLRTICTTISLCNDQIPGALSFRDGWASVNLTGPIPLLLVDREIVQESGDIMNLDPRDRATVLRSGNYGYFGYTEVKEDEKNIEEIAKRLLENPYQDHQIVPQAKKFLVWLHGKDWTFADYVGLVKCIGQKMKTKISDKSVLFKPGIKTDGEDGKTWAALLAVAAEAPDGAEVLQKTQERVEDGLLQKPAAPEEPAQLPLVASQAHNGEEKIELQFAVNNVQEKHLVTRSVAKEWQGLFTKTPTNALRVRAGELITEIARQTGRGPDMPLFLQTPSFPGREPVGYSNGPTARPQGEER